MERAISCALAAVAVTALMVPAASAATRRQQTETVLRNAATAEESYRTSHDSYTERLRHLRNEGLRWDRDRVRLFVSWATESGYCLHARHVRMERPMHFDSNEGRPAFGPCPTTGEARTRWREQMETVLKNAATAQESYATSTDAGYTKSKDDLRAEGFRNWYREVRLVIVRATRTYYCMEARHRVLDTLYFDSDDGRPRRGRCPS